MSYSVTKKRNKFVTIASRMHAHTIAFMNEMGKEKSEKGDSWLCSCSGGGDDTAVEL